MLRYIYLGSSDYSYSLQGPTITVDLNDWTRKPASYISFDILVFP